MANSGAAKSRRLIVHRPASPRPDSRQSEQDEDVTAPNDERTSEEGQSPHDVPVTHSAPRPTPIPAFVDNPLPLHIRMRKPIPPPQSMSISSRVRLLVASLGNPQPYHSTRHSAGHIVLRAFASHLRFPPLTAKSKEFGNGYLSVDESRPEYTLWQSTSLMNVSGAGVLRAWKAFYDTYKSEDDITTGLVVLHDELELAPGALKIRRGDSSAKGHNGVKSVQGSLAGAGHMGKLGDRFIKIGIGIGRPVSRERDDVSAWVLGQITGAERGKIEGAALQLEKMLGGESARMRREE